ncbi:hypothetical protein ACWHA1_28175 [Streptomyces decoyicus]
MNLTELRALAGQVGFSGSDINIAAAVAMAESRGDAAAVGDEGLADNKWGPTFGLFQIRSLRHPERFSPPDALRIPGKLKDPLCNAKTAKAIKDAHTWREPMVHVQERGLSPAHGWRLRKVRAVPWCFVLPHRKEIAGHRRDARSSWDRLHVPDV